MSSLSLRAPAKLNLFLHVNGRRADGYHELQTVFQLLDFGDQIELRTRADGEIKRLKGMPGVTPDADLTVRAARLLKAVSGTRHGCEISVEKQIPAGGGLGGGSSDAACVLVGLNALWALEMSEDRLADLGVELGADVPVFVRGYSAWGEGVGERLRQVSLGDTCYLVLTPRCEVSTAAIFRDPALTRNTPPLTIDRFTSGLAHGSTPKLDFDALWRATQNDCQDVVRRVSAPVDAAFDWLEGYAEARLTGTGASLFAPFPDVSEAKRVLERLPGEIRGFVARGVDRVFPPAAPE